MRRLLLLFCFSTFLLESLLNLAAQKNKVVYVFDSVVYQDAFINSVLLTFECQCIQCYVCGVMDLSKCHCRFHAERLRKETHQLPRSKVVPPSDYPRSSRLPPDDVDISAVFICRQVYDFKLKRILKNPS